MLESRKTCGWGNAGKFVLYPPVQCTRCWTNCVAIGITFLIIVLNDRATYPFGKKEVIHLENGSQESGQKRAKTTRR
jgi:hypothetical protein